MGVKLNSPKEISEFFSDPINNLILNMSAGLLPEHLKEDEVALLEKKYGKDWFEKLGYSTPEYKKPSVLKVSKEDLRKYIDNENFFLCPACGKYNIETLWEGRVKMKRRYDQRCSDCGVYWKVITDVVSVSSGDNSCKR